MIPSTWFRIGTSFARLHSICGLDTLQSMFRFVISLILLAWSIAATFGGEKPNVVVLMLDDFGYECVGANGGESYQTPHMDRLAKEGLRFTRMHAQPLCTPSRVKLMTGLSNVRNYEDFGLLPKGSRTFGHMLQDIGYRTAVIGKWQLLGREKNKIGRGTHPRDAGFHEYCLWQVEQRNSRYWKPVIEQNGNLLQTSEEDFGPDHFLRYGTEFIDRCVREDRPFFLYFPMALTHLPLVSTPANRAERKKLSKHEKFSGMVSYADTIVGRLVKHLEAKGVADNTLFLITGDNGSPEIVQSKLKGRSVKGGKGKTSDVGTHVPLIVSWPGTVESGVCDDLVDLADFVPTIAEATGGSHPNSDLSIGRSFLPQLKGEKGRPHEWLYCFYHPRTEGGVPRRWARDKRWKLYGNGDLYDLRNDHREESPLPRTSRSGKRAKLSAAITEAEKGVPTPDARRETYKQIGEVKLDLFVFHPSGHNQKTDKAPVALFFFGGGWNGGSVAQFAPHCRYLTERGMVAIVADYRVASRHKTSPFECVKDGKSAVRWVRKNAGRLGVDPERIAVGGGSAGGHVAAATATIEGLNEAGEDNSVSAVPNALLLFNPVYDNGPDKGYGYERVKDRYLEISPMHNIRKGMPPAIVFLGTNDKLVPVETGKKFQQKMQEVGSRSDLHLYEDQGHGFFNHSQFKPGVTMEFYDKTVAEMDRFLVSLEFLNTLH